MQYKKQNKDMMKNTLIIHRIDGRNAGESLGLILAWLLAWSGAG